MSRRLLHALAWLALPVAGACSRPAQQPLPLEPADATLYADHVQPYTAIACASLDCHGVAGRPLRLYSELGLRKLDSLRSTSIDDDHAPQPLTQAELDDNLAAFGGIDVEPAAPEHLALLKPLSGAVHHIGGDVWKDERAPGYLCLQGWLEPTEAATDDVALACAQALAALDD